MKSTFFINHILFYILDQNLISKFPNTLSTIFHFFVEIFVFKKTLFCFMENFHFSLRAYTFFSFSKLSKSIYITNHKLQHSSFSWYTHVLNLMVLHKLIPHISAYCIFKFDISLINLSVKMGWKLSFKIQFSKLI